MPEIPPTVRQAFILVGGKGTRLGDIARAVPKPLLDIGNGTVFLDILIEQLARQGFDDIVLLAGHLGGMVRAKYDGRQVDGARLRVAVEPEPLGTAGALFAARAVAAPRFLMLNGDSFFDIDLRALCAAADGAGREATLALRRVPDGARYGSVVLDGQRIVRFAEKNAAAGPALINAGIYVLQDRILERIAKTPCSIETDLFPALAGAGRLYGHICDGYFIDIGLPESLARARRDLAARLRHAG